MCSYCTEDNWAHAFLWKDSRSCVRLIPSPFCDKLANEKKIIWDFKQDNAMAHTVNSSVDAPDEVFGKRVISWGLWHPWSHDLNHCVFYLRHSERWSVYEQSALFGRTLRKYWAWNFLCSCTAALMCVEMISWCEACLEAEGCYFRILL